MIAHSLKHPGFGPAQNMHGATFIVDVTFFSEKLNEQNIVIDIAIAHQVLEKVLKPLDYQNLDELPQFKGKLTTTEFLANYIHQEIKAAVKTQFDGRIKVTLGESHVAWASFEA
jgi:6-pyruvoyl-tetrahydropterin synthase